MSEIRGHEGQSKSGRGRRGRVVGSAASIGVFLSFGLAPLGVAPAAKADFDDLLNDLFDPGAWGTLPGDSDGLLGSSDWGVGGADATGADLAQMWDTYFYTPLHTGDRKSVV